MAILLDRLTKGVIGMPRMARVKAENGKYHVMIRSLKELLLFKDTEDKMKYFSLLQKYQLKYGFKVYAYCLMDNHGHIIIDSAGADISKVMHVVNFSYASYFNRKYDRYGPVFQDRFKSKPINNERYMITLSAYIHNNPKDIVGYENNVKDYPFSSLKEYINHSDSFGILTRSFLENLIGTQYKRNRKEYLNLVKESINEKMEMEIEFINPETEYQSHKSIITIHCNPEEVIAYVSNYLQQAPGDIYVKYKRKQTKIRALVCFFMGSFCNLTQKEICKILGNITQSGVSYLINRGIDIVSQEKEILDRFLAQQM